MVRETKAMSEESRYMFEVAAIEVDEPKSWYFNS
jgi:hypothetical protein